MSRMHNPAHPGAVLKEWLAEVSITQVVRRGLWQDAHAVPPWEWRKQ